jgi:hypothetical protein
MSADAGKPAARAIVLVIVASTKGRRVATLYSTMSFSREEIDDALARLEQVGLVIRTERMVRPSPALTLLDRLWLICLV